MYSKLLLSKKDKDDGDTSRLYRLVTQLSAHSSPLLKLKLLFLQHVAGKFNACVKVLEKEEPLIHVQHELLGKLLLDHLSTFVTPSALEAADSYAHLAGVKFSEEKNHLPPKKVILPAPVKQLLERMEISEKNNAPVYREFMASVKRFNLKCAERLIHYCKIQLTSKVVISMAAFDPSKRSHEGVGPNIMYLQRKFANIVPLVKSEDLEVEVRDYQGAMSSDIPTKWYKEEVETENGTKEVLQDVSSYWNSVGGLKVMKVDNGAMISVQRFPLLFKLATALLTIHHSAAEVERTFSVEKEVLTLKRNKMSQDTFNAHMLIRNNVKTIGGCAKVKAAITPKMRRAYADAPARWKQHLEKRKATLAKETEVLAFNRRRKIKETASLHKYKLSELAKQLVAAERATDLKQSNAANAKQQGKLGEKRSRSNGKDQHVSKKQKK